MREIGSDPAWTFGGPLAGVPADAAWTLLAVAAGLVGVISWISYRTAVAKLGLFTCLVLAGLRMLTLMGLLLCLANPVRIETRERQPPPPAPPPPPRPPGRLVVVVDRSDSMTQPDNRGRSRLDDALATWRRLEKTAQGFFAPATYYSFAADLRPAASLEEAVASRGETGETKLYASVAELLDLPIEERPEAIVVLTDGVDTTSDEETLLQDRAVAAGIPLYFVAGINRSARPEPFVRVRELRTPPRSCRTPSSPSKASSRPFRARIARYPFPSGRTNAPWPRETSG